MISITLQITYCGFHTHNIDKDKIYRPNGSSGYLFLLVLSPMIFTNSDGETELAQPGACILFTPKYYQNYQAEHKFFNSFVEFSSTIPLEEEFDIQYNTLFYPPNYEVINHIIQNIYQEYITHGDYSKEMQTMYLRQLIITLARIFLEKTSETPQDFGFYSEFLSVRLTMLSRCEEEWTVNRLCALLSLGKSQFYKLYRKYFNSSPMDELIHARLQSALFRMTNESMTIRQAALSSGFQNINHFNRIFKKNFNCSPSEYKKNMDTLDELSNLA